MATQPTTKNDAYDPRPRYIRLGTDADGRDHWYRTVDETIHVIHPRRGRVHVEDIADSTPETWMEHAAELAGWDEEVYGKGLVEIMNARGLVPRTEDYGYE